jgi:hypothetical protein
MDNGHFDPHGFGVGGVAVMGLAVAAGVHSMTAGIQDAITDHIDAANAREADELIESVMQQNEAMCGIVARQNVIIDDLYAGIAALQLLLLASEQPSL